MYVFMYVCMYACAHVRALVMAEFDAIGRSIDRSFVRSFVRSFDHFDEVDFKTKTPSGPNSISSVGGLIERCKSVNCSMLSLP